MPPYEDALPHLAAGKSADEEDLIIRRRYRLARKFMPPSGEILLDFGCGTGAQTLLFAPHFPVTIGVDINIRSLERLKAAADARVPQRCVGPVYYDGIRLPLGRSSVDYAISFEVLEHVTDEQEALDELSRVIRPGGVLVLSVPNRWWIFETHGADLPLLPWNRVPFFSWLPKRLHDRYARARNYTRTEIVRKIEHVGFTVLESVYVTAPMDVVKWSPLRNALRKTFFRSDWTRLAPLATAILTVAKRDGGGT
ncbi:MAG: class I SAM-dependent methyltransferase [Candidatus Krumholzibacteria bacterium]